MDLKRFAQESRTRLMTGVARRLLYWGFDAKGNAIESLSEVPGGYMFRGTVHDDPGVPQLWKALKEAIGRKGIDVVTEEAAYTWFNRMMAMQILSKQGFEEPQLDFAAGSLVPQILKRAQQGHAPFLSSAEKQRLDMLVGSFTRDQEALALLVTGYCHHHKTLSRVFGKPDDYTELLLPDDMLKETGFLHLLNTTDALNDEEYSKVELIGWLYQFYISERKDEVFAAFAKGKKAEAKDIPAATQIFTPNWIVKYMVENTAGKVWLDRFPDSPLKGQMQYLVENESDGTREPIIGDVEELTLIDPACGSGHILVEGFGLLYTMYLERFYSPEEAVDSILEHNIYGLDIDDRAAQLATFAVLLKAAKYDRGVWSRGIVPHVYAMPEAKPFSGQEIKDFLGPDGESYARELQVALDTMQDAKNLGSVMKLELSSEAHAFIAQRFKTLQFSDFRSFNEETVLKDIAPFLPILLTMTRKYTAVVANPPYMGQKNMNAELKAYVNTHYPISKADLFAVFMEAMIDMLSNSARVGCITMESWMFLSSYERLRQDLIEKYSIAALAHFGWHIIGIAFGTAVLVLEKSKALVTGEYSYLTIDDIDKGNNRPRMFPVKDNGRFARIPQTNFAKIPGSPIAYWVSKSIANLFEKEQSVHDVAFARVGMATADNARFVRKWSEVNRRRIGFGHDRESAIESQFKWFPYNDGGKYRRWFGNNEVVVNWFNDGFEIQNTKTDTGRVRAHNLNLNTIFRPGITWSAISSGKFSVRYYPEGFLFSGAGFGLFAEQESDVYSLLGLLNSHVAQSFLDILSPTFNCNAGHVESVPFISIRCDSLVNKAIHLAREDWNSREVSWDFEQMLLDRSSNSLSAAFNTWSRDRANSFYTLLEIEEELNSIFIETYGLQDELRPEVPLKDITILQEELDSDEASWNEVLLCDCCVCGMPPASRWPVSLTRDGGRIA
jgi:hypothetical protein